MALTTPTIMNPLTLTTAQFRDALARHIDVSKPDPLSKVQMENLHMNWEQESSSSHDAEDALTQQQQHAAIVRDGYESPPLNKYRSRLLCGTLTLSSEFISIIIRVTCTCKIIVKCSDSEDDYPKAIQNNDCSRSIHHESTTQETSIASSAVHEQNSISNKKLFQNEFYIRLTANAKLLLDVVEVSPSHDDHDRDADSSTTSSSTATPKKEKSNRKERAAKRKLRAGMIKRLRSDRMIRRLLITTEEEHNNSTSTRTSSSSTGVAGEGGVPLCEALIQQNQLFSKGGEYTINSNNDDGLKTLSGGELEERVNVDENSLEGIRNALFSHSEDNLDVLELLLNMPYFPRSSLPAGGGGGGLVEPSSSQQQRQRKQHQQQHQQQHISMLAERAYLRLLEDAMFDACERVGEDELLDDLKISDVVNHDEDDGHDVKEGDGGGVGKRSGKKKGHSKRMKPCGDWASRW